MTVEELVQAKWEEQVIAEELIRLQAAVPSGRVKRILKSLGIWDAEVVEGVELLEHGDTAVAFEPPVRVVVMRAKEKENE